MKDFGQRHIDDCPPIPVCTRQNVPNPATASTCCSTIFNITTTLPFDDPPPHMLIFPSNTIYLVRVHNNNNNNNNRTKMITTPQQQSMFEATACDTLPVKQPKNMMVQPLHRNKSRIESISSLTSETTASCSTLGEEDQSIVSDADADSDDTSNTSNQQEEVEADVMIHVPALTQPTEAAVSTTPHTVLLHANTSSIDTEEDVVDEITTEDDTVTDTLRDTATPTPLPEPSLQPVTENDTKQKQDCRRPCIKDTSHESIPLRNSGWKNLPKLTIPNIKSKFVVSERKSSNQTTKSTSAVVQFGTIEIRSYDVCVGDNPSVSYGTPISLDWDYMVELKDTLEKYESIRSLTKRRNMRQMMMNYNYRRNILLLHWNATEEQLLQAEKEMNIIRSQRNLTRTLLPLSPLEDCVTSLYRKIQRRRNRTQKS